MFVIITILMVIPITAIISNAWLKNQALKAKSGFSNQEKEAIKQLMDENEALKTRIENLEVMIADVDLDHLKSTTNYDTLK